MNKNGLSVGVGGSSRGGVGFTGSNILTTDIRALQARLKEIDPDLRKSMLREAKAIGKPIAQKVSAAIPVNSPFGSRRPSKSGRMQWGGPNSKGQVFKPNTAQVIWRTRSSRHSAVTSLVSVKVPSPMTVLADMAGKSGTYINGGYKGSGQTRDYNQLSKNGVMYQRKHTLNNQGVAMIRKLGGTPSRYAWPAAESSFPAAAVEVEKVIAKYVDIVNGSK